jgi:hypothetical protein
MRSFYPFALAVILTGSFEARALQSQEVALPVAQTPADNKQAQPAAAGPLIEERPVTVRPNGGDAKKLDDTDPVMGVPALPNSKTSLIGGRVNKVDGVRNKISVKIFGGDEWDMAFDERTHFFRDGMETTFENVKKGERVYVDTMLDDHRILARNVRVVTHTGSADARGQVLSVNDESMSIRDTLSTQSVHFQITGSTQVTRNGQAATLAEVQPGSLIAVQFAPDKPNRGVARSITIIAAPGEVFNFSGKVTHLDLSSGMLAVENRTDNRTYDIFFDRERRVPQNLMVGSDVTIAAEFDGRQYKASQINVASR